MIERKYGFILIFTVLILFLFSQFSTNERTTFRHFDVAVDQAPDVSAVKQPVLPKQPVNVNRTSKNVNAKQPAVVAPAPVKSLHVQRKLKLPVNCQKIVDNKDLEEIAKADMFTKHYRDYRKNKTVEPTFFSKAYLEDLKLIPDENYIFDEKKCKEFIDQRGYNKYKVTEQEKAFPLAFTIRTYEQAEQFERFLRIIYRPQNVYCVHVDAKSNPKFHEAIKSITRCFPNVFIATNLVRVYWGGHGLLMADISCMRDLLMPANKTKMKYDNVTKAKIEAFWSHENIKNKRIRNGWKYLLNTASTEFPLKTNRELVQILNVYNGTNDIQMIQFPAGNIQRIQYHWVENKAGTALESTGELKTPPPFNFVMIKSIIFSTLSRAFVKYALNRPEPQALLDWLADTYISDESFFGTLQYNIQFKPPGSFPVIPPGDSLPHMSRFMGWPGNYQCDKAGYRRNAICMLTNGDLNYITNRPNFLANKFQLIDDPVAYSCMEDWYARRHQRENVLSKNGTELVIDMAPYCKYLHMMSSGRVYKGCETFFSNEKH